MTLLKSLPGEEYKCDGNAAVHFKLVRSIADLQDEAACFHPDMCHQVFSESETIFGYKNLRVNVYYTAGGLSCYISEKYTEKFTDNRVDLQADDVVGLLTKDLIPHDSVTNSLDKFASEVVTDKKFKPFGSLKHVYQVQDGEHLRHFEVYMPASIDAPGFRQYHERLQVFLLFYVDGASFIDVDDDRWGYYLVFEKFIDSDQCMRYAIVGYMTFYRYYAYPCNTRPRIAQFLILPPFQKQGHGVQLLETFNRDCMADGSVLDITVEDPVDVFQRLRDFVDCQRLSGIEQFLPHVIKQGFTAEMATVARDTFRINRRQARRCYEILRLRCTDTSNAVEMREYRLDLKRRLIQPFLRRERDLTRAAAALTDTELHATMFSSCKQQRVDQLQQEFDLLMEDYRKVVNRLSTVLPPPVTRNGWGHHSA